MGWRNPLDLCWNLQIVDHQLEVQIQTVGTIRVQIRKETRSTQRAQTSAKADQCLTLTLTPAEPDTTRIMVQHANDSFLTLTSDGINFLLSDQEICDVINQCPDPTEAAQVIAEQALQYGSDDNASILIVPFGAWGKHQSSASTYSMSRNFSSSGRWA
ncbi:protein phosphatase 1K, mitochondrial-like [Sphaeramia orbicularis]|uniref:protein phosphatase 1K, mitochondrial-like n=1 Tax=Sphaeramia orbicularis TaxID=375764 RepID=UPI00117E3A1E|nr:protein phosphatase 1K, mitochondrial-like [Sphaeramia orbicularis]